MRITSLQLKNFRCFDALTLSFDAPIILIEGLNGAGKTSLLEALHYLCYLRSFRTHLPQELIQFGHDNFFIKAQLQAQDATDHEVQVGFGNKKRLVKVDNQAITSYKELLQLYRIVTVTEDDLGLIKEGPEIRRLFVDGHAVLSNPDFALVLRRSKDIVENRNALLKKGGSFESYQLWSQQLWARSSTIQETRIALLAGLQQEIEKLIQRYFMQEFSISLSYAPKKKLLASWEEFYAHSPNLYSEEMRFARSLFGAHLDDFTIHFKEAKSKNFASRGQQKLIAILIKAAQLKLLGQQDRPAILLLDDFMTDFDHAKIQIVLKLLKELEIQLIFTCPTPASPLEKALTEYSASILKLTN